MLDTIVFDVDGTLVDSNYLHLHAWSRAFSDVGVWVPTWRLHACMGMGGDHLVAAAAGDAVENAVGDEVRDRWRSGYDVLLEEVRPLPDALAVLEACRRSGLAVVLATSGHQEHIDRTLQILGLGHDDYPLVSSSDVDSTKPAGDLVERALDVVHGNTAVMVGDTVWDVRAGDAVGVPVIGVLTGGVSRAELHDAGALRVFDDVAALRQALPEVLGVFGSSPVGTVR
jgi:phosphoglycolate phosphatase-like HAD superfamily hydrolase